MQIVISNPDALIEGFFMLGFVLTGWLLVNAAKDGS